jgi:sn-glycerol 3-phosphate transport system permease protein
VPLYWLFSASLKDLREIYTFPARMDPYGPQVLQLLRGVERGAVRRFYLNTIITTFFGVALEVVNAGADGVRTRVLAFPGRNIIFIVMLAALMIPIHCNHTPQLPHRRPRSGWVNTYQG